MVGQPLEHLGARLGLAVGEVGGQVDPLGRGAGAVMKSAFERQIDESSDFFAVTDRKLTCNQWRHAHRLQCGQQIADPAARLVDAVDENHVRDAELVEHPERRGGEGGAGGIGIDHHDCHVGGGNRARPVGGEPD